MRDGRTSAVVSFGEHVRSYWFDGHELMPEDTAAMAEELGATSHESAGQAVRVLIDPDARTPP